MRVFIMEINTVQIHLNTYKDKSLSDDLVKHHDAQLNVPTSPNHANTKEKTQVTLSSHALTMLDIDKNHSKKRYEQQLIEYNVAKREYQEQVNSLPIDYRKMKMAKDQINNEIKALKAELATIEQSKTLNKEEAEQKVAALEQQIATKSLAIIEVSKAFVQQLKEEERREDISSERATQMLSLFNLEPPQAPEESK